MKIKRIFLYLIFNEKLYLLYCYLVLAIGILFFFKLTYFLLFNVLVLVLLLYYFKFVVKLTYLHLKEGNTNIDDFYVDFSDAFGKGKFKEIKLNKNKNPVLTVQDGSSRCYPTTVGWYGLSCLQKYKKTKNKKYLEAFYNQADWFVKNASDVKIKGEKSAIWYFDFDWKEAGVVLKAPWISCLGQASAINVLIRAYKISRKKKYLDFALKAAVPFKYDIKDGGVSFKESGYMYLEEYPMHPYSKVFDGFVFGVLSLHDILRIKKDKSLEVIYNNLIKTLEHKIEIWDYQNIWSYYASYNILCDKDYNKLNAILCKVLYDITGRSKFLKYYNYWKPENKSLISKINIVITKQILKYKYVIRMILKKGNF